MKSCCSPASIIFRPTRDVKAVTWGLLHGGSAFLNAATARRPRLEKIKTDQFCAWLSILRSLVWLDTHKRQKIEWWKRWVFSQSGSDRHALTSNIPLITDHGRPLFFDPCGP